MASTVAQLNKAPASASTAPKWPRLLAAGLRVALRAKLQREQREVALPQKRSILAG